jgi:glutamyl-tRNA(Gln) amidotransferase subunit E
VDESIDYAEVGLKVGLEVHQQLLTDKKMFCHCPAGLYTNTHDGFVLRHMRPTLSELGVYDGTALMEFKTKKNIIYLLNEANVCTYEMDDTPPFLVNQQALDIAIEQCLMLGCDIVDEVHIARKQYLDGSIPTGFQRTAIVGVEGQLPFRNRKLSITQVSMEEDSCREVSDKGHLIVWRTDRLGMPLIETVTGPELKTPEEVEEAILLVGRVCRSTGHVRVGLGASRQDINVSVRGGRRVEIKGVPQAGWAKQLVHGEAIRQVNLLRLRDELLSRGLEKPEHIQIEHKDMTRFFSTSQLEILKESTWRAFLAKEKRRAGFEQGAGDFTVRVVRLKKMAGTLNWPGQPGLSFAHELAGRVRVIATLDQQPILLHSEKWPDYLKSKQDLDLLRRKMNCDPQDSLVVVWGAFQDTLTAVEEIRLRYADAIDGIPNETRQPFKDGSTHFERILPGPDRMYPDTDSPPQRIVRERVRKLQSVLAPPPWKREDRYHQAGVPKDVIHYLIRRNGADLVDHVIHEVGNDLRQVCFFFGERLKSARRRGFAVDGITKDRWCEFFSLIQSKPVLNQAWLALIQAMAGQPKQSLPQILSALGLDSPTGNWVEELNMLIEKAKPDHPNKSVGQLKRFWMGLAMKSLRGRVLAQDVFQKLGELSHD